MVSSAGPNQLLRHLPQPSWTQDGFTHLTADPQLLLSVANQFYQDSEGDWLLLVIDAQKLSSQVCGLRDEALYTLINTAELIPWLLLAGED